MYSPAELTELSQVATRHDMQTHLDGARFANAIASLGCTPAESSWQSGIQLMSFGASKNGCTAAEALLLFGDSKLRELAERQRKRSGHLLSKMRYVSAQLLAYIRDGLWLQLAQHANTQARIFAAAVESHGEAELEYPVAANEVFLRWHAEGFEQLERAGMQFLMWPGRDDLARLVFSYCTDESETQRLCEALTGA